MSDPGGAFLTLGDLLLEPPLPALLTALTVAGLWGLGRRSARALWSGATDAVRLGLGFALAVAVACALVHAAAWAGALHLATLRALCWVIAAVGVAELARAVRAARHLDPTGEARAWARGRVPSLAVATAIAAGLAGAALGPATDADSLDYHLGVPLDWLRHGAVVARPDWLHARLVGLGESANLLGLAGGTDSLGAGLQLAGLALACVALASLGRDRDDRLLGVLLAATCPVVLFLVPNQKPQMLPAAALALALAAVVREPAPERRTLAAALGCIAFAMGCKLSFLMSGGVAAIVVLVVARRQGRLGFALAAGAAAALLFAAPTYARSAWLYGDPLTPFLERYRGAPAPDVVAFAERQARFGVERTLSGLASLPFRLVLPTRPGGVAEILGVGLVAALLLRRRSAATRPLAVAALAAAGLTLALGQLTARFFLEPYLWLGMAVVASAPERARPPLRHALAVQGGLVAVAALVGAAMLLPGSLTGSGRERVMRARAHEYAATRWLDAGLPPEAVLLTNLRSRALVPREFVCVPGGVPDPEGVARDWPGLVARRGVTAVALSHRRQSADWAVEVAERIGFRHVAGARFPLATRNPFNSGATEATELLVARD